MTAVSYQWRADFDNRELNALHSAAFRHAPLETDWLRVVTTHSLGWVVARCDDSLVGFVNVAWDGASHAFLLDTVVSADHRRTGIGKQLVAIATTHARDAGCEWLHVDFCDEHSAFYLEACGFESTSAGVLALR
jgi:GNAT superfamily N-acetyltransferase